MKENFLNSKSEYTVVIENFEGPLDLLLYLIYKNKMNIFDISLNDLTDKYVEYLNSMSELNLDIASEFIVMASTLVNIKSKKLLPEIEPNENEDEITEEEMIARLIEYKKYKEVSETINTMYKSNFGTFSKTPEKIKFKRDSEYIGEKIDILSLNQIYLNILNRNIKKMNVNASQIQKLTLYDKFTVKEKARQIISYLSKNDKFEFNHMFNNSDKPNIEIVTAFLSTLELSKLKQICINQNELFSDIYICKNDNFNIDYQYDFSNISE